MLTMKSKADGSGSGCEEQGTSRRSGITETKATRAIRETGNVTGRRR